MIKKLAKPPAGSGINPGPNEVIDATPDRTQVACSGSGTDFWHRIRISVWRISDQREKKDNSESPFHGEEAMSIKAITSKNNTKADIVERGKNLNGAILSSPVRLKAFWGGHPRRSQLLILRPFP